MKQINFLRGWPNPTLLPTSAIATAAQKALSNPEVSTPGLLYGPDPGYQPLREEIARWLSGFYAHTSPLKTGAESSQSIRQPDPERICITGGASQNLACILQVFTDPLFTTVWMVAPCYFLACRIFQDSCLETRAVLEGDEGIDLVGLERGMRECDERKTSKLLKRNKPWSKTYRHIIYCVPTFSNPSGKTMALSHRESLLVLARKYDALIITDDVYDFLQWPTALSSPAGPGLSSSLTKALLPRIVDIDSTLQPVPGPEDFGNAVSNGSFSKIAGPGVRTGFAEATRKFIYGLSQCGSSRSGGAPSQMTATVMYELLKSSALQAHIEEVLKPAYQKRHLLILQAIVTHLLPLGVTTSRGDVEGRDVFGGYFVWLELPEGIDAEAVTSWSREKENLIIAPGRIFEVEGDESVRFKSGIRLCFAWEEEAELVEGVARLARAIKAVIKGENNWSADSDTEIAKQGFGEFK